MGKQIHNVFGLFETVRGQYGEGNDNPLQYSCLKNPMDGGAWQAAVHGVAESDTTEATQQQQYDLEQRESRV